MKKILICMVCIVSLLMNFVSASEVNVVVDGKRLEGGKLINSVTYVPLRALCETFGDFVVEWDSDRKQAVATNRDGSIIAAIDDKYIESKGRILYSGNGNLLLDGKTYVPVRSLSKALSASVDWDNATKTAFVKSSDEEFAGADAFYDANDLYWLSKIINAESEGESLVGKIAVGNVVLNRVESPDFPNNIYDVIFDTKGGVQFTPVANGTINKAPKEESILAAKICLENYKLTNKNILFFLNPEISTSMWVPNNRVFALSIGKHDFYA